MATAPMQIEQNSGRALPSQLTGKEILKVGSSERLISLFSGGVMAAYGLSRGGISGLLLAGTGVALAYRGATGHCHVYQSLGFSSADHKPSTAIHSKQGVKIEETVTVMKSSDELY